MPTPRRSDRNLTINDRLSRVILSTSGKVPTYHYQTAEGRHVNGPQLRVDLYAVTECGRLISHYVAGPGLKRVATLGTKLCPRCFPAGTLAGYFDDLPQTLAIVEEVSRAR